MSRAREIEFLRAEVRTQHDRLALMRAKHYRWGLGSTEELKQLERGLAQAEQRLEEECLRLPEPAPRPSSPHPTLE